MFQSDEPFRHLEESANDVAANYLIKPNDRLELQVYTQKGERLIDPEFELVENARDIENARPKLSYLVRKDGMVKLPLIGNVLLTEKTLSEAEKFLEEKYAAFYNEPFVNLLYLNKRVTILGNSTGTIIPLENENMRVAEILALSQSIDNDAKASNIRLIRDNEVFLVDFSTIEGFAKSNYVVKPEDIIYIEPIRRPFTEFMRDNGSVISIVASLLSLIVVVSTVN
ncbi:polysaccharide export protein EpsE [Fulvivirga sp. M361]|uniref:polysaccharide biosynthesis/export family protein n=1 Tax=Fulvivirga sp. M361 TaxID=2594266 RepID=UPI001179F035|nr:polysaccharide biosynthesis/export family protein [Fulvivirga sp. M361]TRX48192.1 polysaccharide export protein EpsE [Fulvivirga sp. M361]